MDHGGYDITGVGSAVCARHGAFVPSLVYNQLRPSIYTEHGQPERSHPYFKNLTETIPSILNAIYHFY